MLDLCVITGKFWGDVTAVQKKLLSSESDPVVTNGLAGRESASASPADFRVTNALGVQPADENLVAPLKRWKFVVDSMLQGLGMRNPLGPCIIVYEGLSVFDIPCPPFL